jgi:hypothetical protein
LLPGEAQTEAAVMVRRRTEQAAEALPPALVGGA